MRQSWTHPSYGGASPALLCTLSSFQSPSSLVLSISAGWNNEESLNNGESFICHRLLLASASSFKNSPSCPNAIKCDGRQGMSGRYLSHIGDINRTVFKSCLRCIRRAQFDQARLVCAMSRKTMYMVSKTGRDNTCDNTPDNTYVMYPSMCQ